MIMVLLAHNCCVIFMSSIKIFWRAFYFSGGLSLFLPSFSLLQVCRFRGGSEWNGASQESTEEEEEEGTFGSRLERERRSHSRWNFGRKKGPPLWYNKRREERTLKVKLKKKVFKASFLPLLSHAAIFCTDALPLCSLGTTLLSYKLAQKV